ncbi:flagellar motor protein [Crenobacter sp. SG2303]|uniref:Flagellar motor protein n=1 Tax=Crenobacter oryzisoli TaxID=3056844 RepID=A0ABT7XLD8_9NEIS|nr:flagellar motor protein [Crenobacter sp. SG2303]MDN0074601.1 flagellar motor protein [Crenobacter sp. SG2303]
MDKISFIAIIGGLTAIIAGQALEGGHIGSLLQLTAFLIVVGGTASAVMLQSTPKQFIAGIKMLRWVFAPPQFDHNRLIHDVISWSQTARKGGLLALEGTVAGQKDPFTQKALQMLVDGTAPEALRSTMEVEITMFERARKQAARIWDSAGGYSPTMGILGAVLGLIHVMENLTEPAKLGSGIAVAFVATVYGVGLANLFFLPVGLKLRHLIDAEIACKELVLEGLIGIANGENPRLIESKLKGFLALHD